MLFTGEILYYSLLFLIFILFFYELRNTKNLFLQIILATGILLFLIVFSLKFVFNTSKYDNLFFNLSVLYMIAGIFLVIKFKLPDVKIDFKKNTKLQYFLLLLFFILITMIRNGWFADDAYITYRTIKNFINGYGLRYNIDERVQTFTHPLWLFLQIPFYYEIRSEYIVAITLNLILAFSAVYLLYKNCKNKLVCIFLLIMLFLSKTFIDFSTSGLEDALGYFIVILFLLVFYNYKKDEHKKIFYLSLLTSLAMLTRLDYVLIFIPFYFFILNKPDRKKIYLLLLGLSPIILWEIFSIIYYGFPFPNTFYAKLNNDLKRSFLIEHGLTYFGNFISIDYAGGFLILGFITLFVLNVLLGREPERYVLFPLVIGVILYAIYVIYIGGDFMMGRFFSVLIIASAFGISKLDLKFVPGNIIIIVFIGLTSMIFMGNERSPVYVKTDYIDKTIYNNGLADEKGFYFQGSSLMKILCGQNGIYIGKRDKIYSYKDFIFPRQVVQKVTIGINEYNSLPGLYAIDDFCLADPLRSKMKKITGEIRMGHLKREIPEGYIESLRTNRNLIKDEKIAKYYDKIRLITRGKIFDLKRFLAIIEVNFGLVKI